MSSRRSPWLPSVDDSMEAYAQLSSGRSTPDETRRMLDPASASAVVTETPSGPTTPRSAHFPPELHAHLCALEQQVDLSDAPPAGFMSAPSASTASAPSHAGPSNARASLAASIRGAGPSLLNPSTVSPTTPTSTSQPFVNSPFARPGSRASTWITRIPSEESRALSSPPSPPFGPNGAVSSRGSMILYRLVDLAEEPLLPPPSMKGLNRSSFLSTSGDSISLSSDSKYPMSSYPPEHGFVAYSYDPSSDESNPADAEDQLHDPAEKVIRVNGRAVSWRGLTNLAMLVVLLAALLCLFVVYPVFAFYHDNGRNVLIVGNTRINSTGQAVDGPFDGRSQMPVALFDYMIDPATPPEARTVKTSDGTEYNLVLSDEFRETGVSTFTGPSRLWEVEGRDVRLKWSICVDQGFIELATLSDRVGLQDQIHVWTGSWHPSDRHRLPPGESLDRALSIDMSFEMPDSSSSVQPPRYVRVYQRRTWDYFTCQSNLQGHRSIDLNLL